MPDRRARDAGRHAAADGDAYRESHRHRRPHSGAARDRIPDRIRNTNYGAANRIPDANCAAANGNCAANAHQHPAAGKP